MKSLILTLIAILITGCAWTEINSVVDHEYKNATFKKIMIIAPFPKLEDRFHTEEEFQKAFKKHHIETEKSIDLFPPTRKYTAENLTAILTTFKIDGVLVIGFRDYWQNQEKTGDDSEQDNNRYFILNSLNNFDQTIYYSSNKVRYELKIFASQSWKTAWISVTSAEKNAFADLNEMISSVANSTVKQFVKDGLSGS